MVLACPPLRLVCAWCRSDLKTGLPLTDAEYEADGVSHGICPGCAEQVLGKLNSLDHARVTASDAPADGAVTGLVYLSTSGITRYSDP